MSSYHHNHNDDTHEEAESVDHHRGLYSRQPASAATTNSAEYDDDSYESHPMPALADSIETMETAPSEMRGMTNDSDDTMMDDLLTALDEIPSVDSSTTLSSTDANSASTPQSALLDHYVDTKAAAQDSLLDRRGIVDRSRNNPLRVTSSHTVDASTGQSVVSPTSTAPLSPETGSSVAAPSASASVDTRIINNRSTARRDRAMSPPPSTIQEDTDNNSPHNNGEFVFSKSVGAAPPRPVTPSRRSGTTPTSESGLPSPTFASGTSARSASPNSRARSLSPAPTFTPSQVITKRPASASATIRPFHGMDGLRLSLVGNTEGDMHAMQKELAALTAFPNKTGNGSGASSQSSYRSGSPIVDAHTNSSQRTTEENMTSSPVSTPALRDSTSSSTTITGSMLSPVRPRQQGNRIRVIRSSGTMSSEKLDSPSSKANDSNSVQNSTQLPKTPSEFAAGPTRHGMSQEDWEAKQRAKHGPSGGNVSRSSGPSSVINASVVAIGSSDSSVFSQLSALQPGAVSVTSGGDKRRIRITGSSQTNDARTADNARTADTEMMEAKQKARAERDAATFGPGGNAGGAKAPPKAWVAAAASVARAPHRYVNSDELLTFEDDSDSTADVTVDQPSSRKLLDQHYKSSDDKNLSSKSSGEFLKTAPPSQDAGSNFRHPARPSEGGKPISKNYRSEHASKTHGQLVQISEAAIEDLDAGPQYLSDEEFDLGEDDDKKQATASDSNNTILDGSESSMVLDDVQQRMGPTSHGSMVMAEQLRASAPDNRASGKARVSAAAAAAATEKSGMRVSQPQQPQSKDSVASGSGAQRDGSMLSRRMRREQTKFSNLERGERRPSAQRGRSSQASVTSSAVSDLTTSDTGSEVREARENEKNRRSTQVPNAAEIMIEESDETNHASVSSNQDSIFDLADDDDDNDDDGGTQNPTESVAQPSRVDDDVESQTYASTRSQQAFVSRSNVMPEHAITAELVTADPLDEEDERERIRKEAEREAEERLRSNAVIAEAHVVEDEYEEEPPRRNRLCIWIAILVAMAAIVIVVVVIVTRPNDDPGGRLPEATVPPTPLPFNDVCELAHELNAAGDVANTNNQNASPDEAACDIENQSGLGVWYTLEGNGKRLRVSTCTGTEIDTQIQVFSGDCDTLSCIGGNDQLCGDQSSVGWLAESDTTYKILVSGFRASNTGPITLTLEEISDIHQCSTSEIVDESSVLIGSTRNVDTEVSLESCGGADAVSSIPTAWYRVEGDGKTKCASLINRRDFLFESQLSIVSGDCDNSVCVDGLEPGSAGEVMWTTEQDIDYYVVVHGSNNTPEGDFQLTIRFPPENTICDDAMELLLNSSLTEGTTNNACMDNSFACSSQQDSPGVWYTFLGTGSIVTVSTCGTQSSKTTMMVTSGENCDMLTCDTAFVEQSCGDQTSIFLQTNVNQTYFVFVQSSVRFVAADFLLLTEEVSVSQECNTSVELDDGGAIAQFGDGTITSYNTTAGETIDTAGVWYSFAGDGEDYVLSTCNDPTSVATEILVFRGDCDLLDAVETVSQICDSGMIISLPTIANETYSVLVQSRGIPGITDDGLFELTVTPGRFDVENDFCEIATKLETPRNGDITSIFGTTNNATMDDVPFCGLSNSISNPVWYSLEGRGSNVTASLCSGLTTFDTQIYVYSGNCGSLTCVAADDDSCGGVGSIVTWSATDGQTFYILVGGHVDIGDFRLELGEVS